MTEQEIAALKAERDHYQKLAQLPDAHRAYHARLDVASASSFLSKSVADQKIEIDGATIYKSTDGTVYLRGQEQMASLAKSNDELRANVAKEQSLRMRGELRKTAEDHLGHCAGTEDTAIAIVGALNTITDEPTRKAAFEMLMSGNMAAKALEESHGHNQVAKSDDEVNAEQAYYTGLAAYAKTAGLNMALEGDRAKASLAFMSTPNGASLYKAYTDSKPSKA